MRNVLHQTDGPWFVLQIPEINLKRAQFISRAAAPRRMIGGGRRPVRQCPRRAVRHSPRQDVRDEDDLLKLISRQ